MKTYVTSKYFGVTDFYFEHDSTLQRAMWQLSFMWVTNVPNIIAEMKPE